MEVNEIMTYPQFLINLLEKNSEIPRTIYQKDLKVNFYLTLLTLSGSIYDKKIYQEEQEIIDDFLRKVNNLKIKIQLKSKEEHIDTLLNSILSIYQEKSDTINKYNKDNLDINNILKSKNKEEITNLIDKFTKLKMHKNDLAPEYNQKREEIANTILHNPYYLEEEYLYILTTEKTIKIPITEFYEIFDYLLDIKYYPNLFNKKEINTSHLNTIASLIKFYLLKEENNPNEDSIYISLILTYLINTDMNNFIKYINTSKFKIDNIKITELYLLAAISPKEENTSLAKWNKVTIPNDYLFDKIKEITKKGTYYFKDDYLILENIINNTSDFKISINTKDMITILKSILLELTEEKAQIKSK